MNLAVGILFCAQIFFMTAFEPSNFEAYLFGPKTLILFIFKKSTKPLTKGSSGPITTKSILWNLTEFRILLKSKILISTFVAILLVPAFPG